MYERVNLSRLLPKTYKVIPSACLFKCEFKSKGKNYWWRCWRTVVLCLKLVYLLQLQKQPSIGVLIKRCSKNIQKIYRRTSMPKFDINSFIETTLRHGCSPVNLLHISEHLFLRTPLDSCFCNYIFLSAKIAICSNSLLSACKIGFHVLKSISWKTICH